MYGSAWLVKEYSMTLSKTSKYVVTHEKNVGFACANITQRDYDHSQKDPMSHMIGLRFEKRYTSLSDIRCHQRRYRLNGKDGTANAYGYRHNQAEQCVLTSSPATYPHTE